MTRVAIIAAFPGELEPLVRGWEGESRDGVRLWRRRSGDGEWIAACAGVGADSAARAFVEIEKGGAVDSVVSTGWAGALREGFAAGRAYGVSEVVDASTGERFPATAGAPPGCTLVTSQRFADPPEKRRLASLYGAGLVDMEAAGVARLAGVRRIPFHCVKGVSDGFADLMPDFNRFIDANGRFHLVRFVVFAIFRPMHWPALIRIGGNSRRAAHGIRESVLDILDESRTIAKREDCANPKR